MRKTTLLLIFSLTLLLLGNANTHAQWEGAEVQQLTHDDLPNRIVGLYVDDTDELFLLYAEGVRDTLSGFVYDYTLLYTTREKGGNWSEPQEIQTPEYIIGQSRKSVVGFDTRTRKTHILYYGRALYDTLYYTNTDIPNWEFLKVDSLEQGHEYVVPDIAFDSLGNVHVVWYESYWSGGRWAEFWYANNSTGTWAKQPVSPPIYLGWGSTHGAILAVQNNGIAHIVYEGLGVSECYYVRNDSLNSDNWVTDTIPRPSIPLCSHRFQELLADASDRIHLFTQGYSCTGDTIFQLYFHKQGDDSVWSEASLVQVHPPDSGVIGDYFVDSEYNVHLSLAAFGGFSVFYTNNKLGSWLEPKRLLHYHEAPFAGESFSFVIDSENQGHGAYTSLESPPDVWDEDSFEVYYYSPSNSSVDGSEESVLPDFALFQNYPNPFNSVTSIQYTVSSRQNHPVHTTLKIYNTLGKEVRELVNTNRSTGSYSISWDGKNNAGKEVASGIYFYQLTTVNHKQTKRMIMLK
ncbi:MAG: FlgD immunoglobulin-like domain containing protein [Candidatus Zixiibacteriota bacterium]